MGERKFAQMVLVTWPRWPPCPYMVKTLKKVFFSGTKRPMTLNHGMHHWVLEYYQICSTDDPGSTLTYFTARSNLDPYAFVWEKRKTMDFSETIAVYDLKLATDDRSDKKFLLTSKLCPLGVVCPLSWGYIHWTNNITVHFSNCIFLSKRDSITIHKIRNYLPGYGFEFSDIVKYLWCFGIVLGRKI